MHPIAAIFLHLGQNSFQVIVFAFRTTSLYCRTTWSYGENRILHAMLEAMLLFQKDCIHEFNSSFVVYSLCSRGLVR